MSVAQMKDFVAKDLKSLKATHKSLTIHISACEEITKRKTASGELEDQLATEHGRFATPPLCIQPTLFKGLKKCELLHILL